MVKLKKKSFPDKGKLKRDYIALVFLGFILLVCLLIGLIIMKSDKESNKLQKKSLDSELGLETDKSTLSSQKPGSFVETTSGDIQVSAIGVGDCRTINQGGVYDLNKSFNISSQVLGYNCILINASNVVLNGNGYTINSNDKNSNLIYVANSSNLTIKNLIITGSNMGIMFVNVNNSLIQNNTFNNNSAGIFFSYSSNNILTNNTANNNSHGIYLNYSSNNNLTSNTADYNINDGIHTGYSPGNRLTNNVMNYNLDDGIQFDYSSNNTLTNNSAIYNLDDGIYLYESSSNNSLNLNLVDYNSFYGLHIKNSSNNNLTNNTANNNSYGIYLESSSNNNLFINNIANYNNFSGIYIYSSKSNIFTNDQALKNNISDIYITNSNETYLIDCLLAKYNITSEGSLIYFKSTGNGEINFLSPISVFGTDLSSDVKIGANSVYVNSSKSGLNISANITLYGLSTSFSDPVMIRDGQVCPASICTNLSSLNAGNVTFNVTSFSTYSVNERSSTIAHTGGGSGGGGSGGGAIGNTYFVTSTQLIQAFSKLLTRGDKIILEMVKTNSTFENQTLIINKISNDSVSINIQNLNITLKMGEEKKLNLKLDDYYDLSIKLNSIVYNKVNLTIKSIYELKPLNNNPQNNVTDITNQTNQTNLSPGVIVDTIRDNSWIIYIIIFVLVFLIVVVLIKFIYSLRKKKINNNPHKIDMPPITLKS
jgi:parallel beta-helix repeat protein